MTTQGSDGCDTATLDGVRSDLSYPLAASRPAHGGEEDVGVLPAGRWPRLTALKAKAEAVRAQSWLVVALVAAASYGFGAVVPPSCRPFQLTDPSIGYPFDEHETFPTYTLAFISVLPVLLVYAPVVLLHSSTVLPAWREVNAWALVQALSVTLNLVVSEPTKVYAGRLRPDFADRLRRAGLVVGSDPPLWANGTASAAAVCTTPYLQSNHELRDGHLSFPSGHSSTAFAAMVPLCLFLVARLRPFYHQSAWRLVVSLLPLVLAIVVAVSRTLNHRHHFSDILAGAVIGTAAGAVSAALYLQYVPALGIWAVRRPPTDSTARAPHTIGGTAHDVEDPESPVTLVLSDDVYAALTSLSREQRSRRKGSVAATCGSSSGHPPYRRSGPVAGGGHGGRNVSVLSVAGSFAARASMGSDVGGYGLSPTTSQSPTTLGGTGNVNSGSGGGSAVINGTPPPDAVSLTSAHIRQAQLAWASPREGTDDGLAGPSAPATAVVYITDDPRVATAAGTPFFSGAAARRLQRRLTGPMAADE